MSALLLLSLLTGTPLASGPSTVLRAGPSTLLEAGSVESGSEAERLSTSSRQTAPTPWAGEERRVHWGVSAREHVGLMFQGETLFGVLETEVLGLLKIRLGEHDELRIQLGSLCGWPDTCAVESMVGYRFHLSPGLSLGADALGLWGLWSLRAGVELPIALRLGERRRHEVSLAFRATAGVYNNITFVWWDFASQRFAVSVDLALGYAFLF